MYLGKTSMSSLKTCLTHPNLRLIVKSKEFEAISRVAVLFGNLCSKVRGDSAHRVRLLQRWHSCTIFLECTIQLAPTPWIMFVRHLRPQRSNKFYLREKRKVQERKLKMMRGTQRSPSDKTMESKATEYLIVVHYLVTSTNTAQINIYSPSLTFLFTSGLYFCEHP